MGKKEGSRRLFSSDCSVGVSIWRVRLAILFAPKLDKRVSRP